MGELEEWKSLLKQVGTLVRKVVALYVEEVEQEFEKKPEKPKTYTCKQCGETFPRAVEIASHVRYKHPK